MNDATDDVTLSEQTADVPSHVRDAGPAADPATYEAAALDAMPPSLVDEDRRTGRTIALMLCGLFLYTVLAMGYVVYVTYTWTH